MMYPQLFNCRVRGAEGDFYLHQYRLGQEFVLEPLHAQVLLGCNGSSSISQLAVEHGQTEEDVLVFLDVIEEAGMLKYLNSPSKMEFAPLVDSPHLREVHVDVTGWCNLFGKCKHCYGRQVFQEATKDQLDTAEMCVIIDQMAKMNVAESIFSGGEAFTRKDLPELILRLAKRQVHLSAIFTNGTIWRQDVIDAIRESDVNTSFLVSVDGPTPQVNDFMRGEGGFQKTISFIKRLVEDGFRVVVNTVVIKQNVHYLMDLYRLLESLGVYMWRLSVPREQGETIVNKDLIIPDWQDVFTAYEQLIRHVMDSPGRMKFQVSSIFKSELLEEPVYYLFRPESSCCEYKRWSITVKPNGNVTPCTAFDNLVLGNLRTSTLKDIWYSDSTQAFKSLPVMETECQGCRIAKYCGGGCRKVAWELHGSVLAKDDTACPLYEFADRVIRPMLESRGIRTELLAPTLPYKYDPSIINSACL